MSVRVDNVEDDISSILARANRPAVSQGWVRPRAPQDLAVQEATELLNEYGKDAYWLACACARRSSGALGRHWEAVTNEIEQRTGRGRPATPSTGRKSPATPSTGRRSPAAPRKTVGSLRAALDQLAPRNVDFTRLGAYHAGAPDDLYEAHSRSHGRDHHASQIAAKGFDRYQEDLAEAVRAARAAHERADNSDRAAATDWHDEELYDDPPRKGRRRGLVTALALIGCAAVGTAGAYVYRTYYGPPSTLTSTVQPAQPAVRGAPPAAKGAVGGYIVQVSARRSKADAQASFLALQSKFPRQLGGRTAIFQRADLGAKGIYYRAMVGPFASAGAADQFCGSLKSAGGECIVQRN
jgi:sporulation related protein